MLKRIVTLVLLIVIGCALYPVTARAQDPDPGAQVFNELVGAGFDVVEVGNFPDAQGNPDPNAVYAEMETVTTDLNDRYILNQTLTGFKALNKYFPNEQYYVVVLRFDRWLMLLVTNPQDWDDFFAQRVKTADYWNTIRSQVRIFDTVDKKFVTSKDFTNINQTNKNQTNKDFSGQGKSPLPPVNTNPSAQAENILFEPSTTYLPADGTSQAYLLATLTDRDYAGLPGRGVYFTYEARGQDERPLPLAQTDQFGTARSKIASSRALDLVLLRASTSTLNAQAQILVGAPPGNDSKAREKAVVDGLKSQGYQDADAGYLESTGPAGNTIRQALAAVRVTSNAFDREVYSQLARMMGTLRTVMPDAGFLRPLLLYAAADGHDYTMLFTMPSEIWDAYIRGAIGENQLWSSLSYDGAVDENGVRTSDKDFLSKNFTRTKQTHYSSVARTVESTLTTETWGDQLTIGSFLVPVGGFADTFSATELSGSATGFTIYETPDYNNAVLTYTRGDESVLNSVRLDAGQYVISVNATSAPAKLVLQYIEHLGR